jgi:SSS family solute:Na+ symporter
VTAIHLTAPDYVIILGYFAVVLMVGLYFNKRQTASQDYFAGGHQVSWWLAGISHYMSSFSAFTFIAYSQIAYLHGMVAITLFWVTAPACAVGGLLFARRWRRARVVTPVEFLEKRFNASLRQLFAWAGIPVKIFDDALKIFATALILSTSVGINLQTSILVCGTITVTYTLLGGLWALVVTDYIQFLMKIAAMLLLLPLCVIQVGGFERGFQALPPGNLNFVGAPYGWTYLLSFLCLIIISYNATWALAQKYYCVPDERSATKAAYLSAALNLVGTPLMLLPAIIGRPLLPDLVAQHRTADTYVLLVLKLLPVGMVGIIVAAMFSATMAAISADLNAIASVLTRDVYLRLLRPGSSESTLVRVGRMFTTLLGAIIIVLSIWIALSHRSSLFQLMVTAFGLFLAPTMLPVLAGLTVRWLTWKGAVTGFVMGLCCGITTFSVKTWYLPSRPDISADWISYSFEGISIFLNISVTALGLWLGSIIPAESAEEKRRIDTFFENLDRPIAPSEIRAPGNDPARPALGIGTATVGFLLVLAGILSTSPKARWIDIPLGLLLFGFGLNFFRAASRVEKQQPTSVTV